MNLLMFLLKSSACLALLLVFYTLVLEGQRMHVFKRFYLLASLLLSLIIPSITFTEYVEVDSVPETVVSGNTALKPDAFEADLTNSSDGSLPTIIKSSLLVASNPSPHTPDRFAQLPALFWSIYAIGAFIFALKFFRNLWNITQNIRHNPKRKSEGIIKVLLKKFVQPHTFFHYIFLNEKHYERREIPPEVILHEHAHAKQIHGLDILLVELLHIVFWFNPLLYLAKKSIKLNHEFLADQAVLEHGATTPGYQEILLAFASSAKGYNTQPSLANAIHYSSYSSIKKRFTVMKTKTSKKSIIWRSMSIVPMLALLFLGFSSTVEVRQETETGVALQEGATKQQVREYNGLAKKYNKMLAKKGNIRIKTQEVDRLEYLYGIMTESQQKEAEPFPDFPEPPVPPMPPSPPEQSDIEVEKVDMAEPPSPPNPPGQKNLQEEQNLRASNEKPRAKEQQERLRQQMGLTEEQQTQIRRQAREMAEQAREMSKQLGLTEEQRTEIRNQAEKMAKQVEKMKEQAILTKEQQAQIKKQAKELAKQARQMWEEEGQMKALRAEIEKQAEEMEIHIEEILENEDFIALREEIVENIIENQEIYDAIEVNVDTDMIQNTIENHEIFLEELEEMKKTFGEESSESQDSTNRITLNYRKGGPSSAPAPPSPPAPKSPLELLRELKDENLTILIDGEETSFEEAEKLFEENTYSRIHVRKVTDDKKETGEKTVLSVWTD